MFATVSVPGLSYPGPQIIPMENGSVVAYALYVVMMSNDSKTYRSCRERSLAGDLQEILDNPNLIKVGLI